MRRAAAACSLVVTGSLMLGADGAAAQEGIVGNLQKSLDSTFSSVSTTTTDATGAVTKTDTINVNPRLTLSLDTLLYPSLRLNAGGVFEANRAFSDLFSPDGTLTSSDSTISRIRPFVLLRSTNRVFSPGVGFFRREDRSRFTGFTGTKLVNDDYAAYLGWNPEGGPQSDFQYVRTNTFDEHKNVLDIVKDYGSLISNYEYRAFTAYYRGAYLDTDDRIAALETRQVTQSGRFGYSGSFIDKRLVWNGVYTINNQDLTTIAHRERGEVDVPIIPNGGLAALDDIPVTAVLSPNPLLVDGNLTAGSGINLGLPAAGADSRARNLGLDFLNPTEVNRIRVWIDRELPVEVAASFTWEVYSSPDNVVWRREATVSAARLRDRPRNIRLRPSPAGRFRANSAAQQRSR